MLHVWDLKPRLKTLALTKLWIDVLDTELDNVVGFSSTMHIHAVYLIYLHITRHRDIGGISVGCFGQSRENWDSSILFLKFIIFIDMVGKTNT